MKCPYCKRDMKQGIIGIVSSFAWIELDLMNGGVALGLCESFERQFRQAIWLSGV